MFLIDDYIALKAVEGVLHALVVTPLERMRDLTEEEFYGEDKIKQELLELQMKLEMDELTEEEYAIAEAALMKRLEEGQQR